MTPIQHSVIIALYELEQTNKCSKWYVKTRTLKTSVIKSLYRLGMIETDKAFNNLPTRFRLSEEGRSYGREHYKGSEKCTHAKNKFNAIRNKYDHYDFVTRRSNNI